MEQTMHQENQVLCFQNKNAKTTWHIPLPLFYFDSTSIDITKAKM